VAHDTKAAARPKVSQLPAMVVSPADVSRLVRELETVNGALLDRTLRKKGQQANMLKTSQLLDQLIELNKLNLLEQTDRDQLTEFLQGLKKQAPVLHMSFSADPSAAFLDKLMTWLRREIHPNVLLTIGLQPTIGAGCILRTTNKYFDFSLREDFAKKRLMLLDQLIPAPKQAKS
jgi:F0F1-type ATP synthase delta subunit